MEIDKDISRVAVTGEHILYPFFLLDEVWGPVIAPEHLGIFSLLWFTETGAFSVEHQKEHITDVELVVTLVTRQAEKVEVVFCIVLMITEYWVIGTVLHELTLNIEEHFPIVNVGSGGYQVSGVDDEVWVLFFSELNYAAVDVVVGASVSVHHELEWSNTFRESSECAFTEVGTILKNIVRILGIGFESGKRDLMGIVH